MSDTSPLQLCLLEGDPIMGESLCYRFELEGFHCDWYKTALAAQPHIADGRYDVLISDIRLPDLSGAELFAQLQQEGRRLPPTLFITGFGSIGDAVELLKRGAADYITKPFDLDTLVEKVRAACRRPIATDGEGAPVLGISAVMRALEQTLCRVSQHGSTVLITGESGAGKEHAARFLHRCTFGDGKHPFVAVNCGAIPEGLMEAELFGYEKGAFTGAVRTRHGVFEQAEGGTPFLDEIGEMPPNMQVRSTAASLRPTSCFQGLTSLLQHHALAVSWAPAFAGATKPEQISISPEGPLAGIHSPAYMLGVIYAPCYIAGMSPPMTPNCLLEAWRAHEGELKGYLHRRMADPEEADDLLQDIFVKALRQSEHFCSVENARAWLFQVARNALADRLRVVRDYVDLPEELPHDVEEAAPVETLADCLPRALAELPPEDREALTRCDLEGMSQEAYAKLKGLSLPGAKSRVQRARKRLRQHLTDVCRVRFDETGRVCCFVPRKPE